ncbi:MAG: hypothetical protein IJS90_02180, partial [Clostridia bacterium]|nr:hypothetical protein [Clostridia bacterium]
ALLEELPDNESQSVFVITDDEQEVIEPDDIYTDSEIPEYYVTVNTDQDRSDVLGGGTYMRGEFAQVQAFPDSCSTFVGWFEGDECVSEDLDYRFSVKNDIELTAVFADSHEYAETEREEPTCTEKGYVTYVCSRCDDTYTEDIDPRGHIYAIRITPATCTSSGFTTCTCTLCGDTFTKDPVPALSHVDADGDGYCDYGCGANMGAPQSNCVCGEFHGGPFASIIIFFHRIVYFFKNLFK